MIRQIIRSLQANPGVTDWLISEKETRSFQTFYVLQKLETVRTVDTLEYGVTVYHRFEEGGTAYTGSSSFVVSHKMPKQELDKTIAEAVFASGFIKNKAFDLVVGGKKQTWKEKPLAEDPFSLLDRIAETFIGVSSPNVRFNALEIFYNQVTERVVNSRGVDLKSTLYKVSLEAIPSYDGEKQNVELYKFYNYKTIDFAVIQQDAVEALKDVTARYQAEAVRGITNVDVLLKDENVAEFFYSLIEDYSYPAVYRQFTDKKIGDAIQKDIAGDVLTIGFTRSSNADAFDADGILRKPTTVVGEGRLVSFYGNNQYAQYLNMVPTGTLNMLEVPKGRTPVEKLAKKPHLDIIALSGIQIDMYSGYIGGEVRLGVYFDGKDYFPVSGFSFSGNIDKCLSHLTLSKETVKLVDYQGPKYIRLPGMEIL